MTGFKKGGIVGMAGNITRLG